MWGIRHGTGNKVMGRDETPGRGTGGHQRTGPKKAPKNIKGMPIGKAPRKRKKKRGR